MSEMKFQHINLCHIPDSELLDRFGYLVRTERKITYQILRHIAEIDKRRLYLPTYTSLFSFLVKKYSYSHSAAGRRISSARLLMQVPEVSTKIVDGSLNLTQLDQVHQAIRFVQKTEHRKVEAHEKVSLLAKIECSTQRETELILAQELSLPISTEDKTVIHKDESMTMTITFSKEQRAVLEQSRDLTSHSVPDKSWASVVTYLAQKEVDRKTKMKNKTPIETKMVLTEEAKVVENSKADTIVDANTKAVQDTQLNLAFPSLTIVANTRHPLSPRLRKYILNRDKCCQFKDPLSKEICGNTRFLQIDHIQPIWAGGSNEVTNLQGVCAQHNQFKYRKEAGLSLYGHRNGKH